jgi:release factor glutamine methyltransferase
MRSPTKKTCFGEYIFDVCEDVYAPAEDSFLFAENLDVKDGAYVLDMGTGCGILGVLAAKKASEVLSVDINPHAVRCAKQNAAVNGVGDKIAFLQSDLFASIGDQVQFDLILFNAPYLPSEEGEVDFWLGRAWAGGATGRQVIDRFISQVPCHLKRTGQILLLQSTLSNVEETQRNFAKWHLSTQVVAELALPFFEKLVLLEANFSV